MPTIYDVAKLAGVSHQTVSRHIKGQRVADPTKLRVESAIETLGYRPNSTARALARQTNHRIAAVTDELNQYGPMALISGASAAARSSGYVLDIVNLNPADIEATTEALTLIQHELAGVLVFVSDDALLDRLRGARLKVPLFFDGELESTSKQDPPGLNVSAGRIAADHLLNLGHKRISVITGPLDWPSSRLRLNAFMEELDAHGIGILEIAEGNWTAQSGHDLAIRLMDSSPSPTAIFAANDQMAIGAMSALSRAGLRIPDDISVMGLDDGPESAFTIPSLTSIPMRFAEQGRWALEALISQIENREDEVIDHQTTTELIVRESTGPASPSR